MKLHTLQPAKGATHKEKRIGRGEGSGHGGTSTRGHKGAQSRSGYSRKKGFEGGQMPLQRRLPKFGFKNPTRVEYKAINLDIIEQLVVKHNLTSITPEVLVQYGLVSPKDLIKVLAKGVLTKKVDVHVHAFSESAKNAIEKLSGTAVVL